MFEFMKKKMFFPRRIAEPRAMGKIELDAFAEFSAASCKRWLIPLVDGAPYSYEFS